MNSNNNLSAQKAIEEIIADLESQLKHWKYSLTLLRGAEASLSLTNEASSPSVPFRSNGYPRSGSNKQKAAFILKTANRFLHISEINQMFIELEGINENDQKAIDGLRTGLTALKNDNVATNYKAGNSNQSFVWGSVKWLDDKGKPKPEFMYKEGLFDNMKEEIDI